MGSPNMLDERTRKLLARNLKALLEHAEMTQYALSQKTKNLSQKQLNNIAEARTGCGIDALSEIADVLRVPVWVLLYDHTEEIAAAIPRLVAIADGFSRASESDRELMATIVRKVAR